MGKKLAKSIIPASRHRRPLLTAGTTLTPRSIEALRRRGYSTVMVENELIPGLEIPDVLCDETRAQALQVLSDTAARVHLDGEVGARPVKKAVEAILAELTGDLDLAFSLTAIRSVDEYTFQHSLDVCVYSVILGRHRGYSQDHLIRLGIGALLHDIGKVRMGELITKRGSLTETEWVRIKEHPRIGYDLLRSNFEISLLSAHVAFQHHERWDGTGYPRGLKRNEIHEFGLIAAVADVWSALTMDRPYRAAMDPVEAAETITGMAGTALDPDLTRALLSRVARYPTGSIVLLEDMRVGVVTAQESGRPERPVVTIAADGKGKLIEPEEIRLVNHSAVMIRRILPDWPVAIREKIARLKTETEEKTA